jgi:hypothetical protein
LFWKELFVILSTEATQQQNTHNAIVKHQYMTATIPIKVSFPHKNDKSLQNATGKYVTITSVDKY